VRLLAVPISDPTTNQPIRAPPTGSKTCASSATGPQQHPLAAGRRALCPGPGDELRRLAADLGSAEDERVGSDVLHNLDLGCDSIGRELEGFRPDAEHELVPAAGGRRGTHAGRERHVDAPERHRAVRAELDGEEVHRR